MERKNFTDVVVSTFLAVFLSLAAVVAFGFLAKAISFSETVLKIAVIAIKLLSLAVGMTVGIKRAQKGLAKGLAVGVLYSAVCYLTFFLANGFSLGDVTVFDVLLPVLFSAAWGVLTVNVKEKTS